MNNHGLTSRQQWTNRNCPCCGHPLKTVIATGYTFCSNHEMICEYEEEPSTD